MSIYKKAVQAYDALAEKGVVGVYNDGYAPLSPVFHVTLKSNVVVYLDNFGNKTAIELKPEYVIVPATENSESRTSGYSGCQRPLCDCANRYYEKNYLDAFMELFSKWKNSEHGHPVLDAVYAYVSSGNAENDFSAAGVKKSDVVRWVVDGVECWKCKPLNDAWAAFYVEYDTGKTGVCEIYGTTDVVARKLPHNGNFVNFYSRPSNADVAMVNQRISRNTVVPDVVIGRTAMWKATNFMNWAYNNSKVNFFKLKTFAWDCNGDDFRKDLEDNEKYTSYPEYQKSLYAVMNGKNDDTLDENVVVVSFLDEKRKALVSVTEMRKHDYIRRIADWKKTLCWYDQYGFLKSPSIRDIVKCVHGIPTDSGFDIKKKEKDAAVSNCAKRLYLAQLYGNNIPLDIVQSLESRISKLGIYSDRCKKELLWVACAVSRKHLIDTSGIDVFT